MRRISGVLPEDVLNYNGDGWVGKFTLFLTVVITIRSAIHIARHDGGAATIAGIDINVEGGQNLVAILLSGDWCSCCWLASRGSRSFVTED